MRMVKTPIIIGGVIASVLSGAAQAEITVLEKNSQSNALLAPLSLQVGGSIRPEFIFNNGPEPGYYKNGHDGGTRFRFSGDYALSDETSVIANYEWGVDLAHVLEWDSHYREGGDREYQRKFYGGLKDSRYGTLTFGQQFGIYYSVIGIKSDVWDNDGHAGGTGIGINGDYDGGNRPKDSLMYTNDFGPVTFYANYLFPEKDLYVGNVRYNRAGGGGLGIDYHIDPTLTWSVAYSYTESKLKNSVNDDKKYHQQLSGTALTWQPNNWYIVGTASYYDDYVPSTRAGRNISNYFAGAGYGLEGFAGYTFKFDQPFLESIQPYVAVDSMRLKGDEDYHANHVYLGAGTTIGYGLSVYVERTLASTTDKEPDSTWITVFYDF